MKIYDSSADDLWTALNISSEMGPVLSVVGAGGKSSVIRHLSNVLNHRKVRHYIGTTTHMWPMDGGLYGKQIGIVDKDGKVLGKHKGVVRYTVGQRKGLGISLGKHVFVTNIDPEAGTVTLGDECDLFTKEFEIDDIIFQKRKFAAGESVRLFVKIRYAASPVPCTVEFCENSARVILDEPARAVTPGQSAVFYDEQGVVFGGFIR